MYSTRSTNIKKYMNLESDRRRDKNGVILLFLSKTAYRHTLMYKLIFCLVSYSSHLKLEMAILQSCIVSHMDQGALKTFRILFFSG